MRSLTQMLLLGLAIGTPCGASEALCIPGTEVCLGGATTDLPEPTTVQELPGHTLLLLDGPDGSELGVHSENGRVARATLTFPISNLEQYSELVEEFEASLGSGVYRYSRAEGSTQIGHAWLTESAAIGVVLLSTGPALVWLQDRDLGEDLAYPNEDWYYSLKRRTETLSALDNGE